jgi:hypothetical protein
MFAFIIEYDKKIVTNRNGFDLRRLNKQTLSFASFSEAFRGDFDALNDVHDCTGGLQHESR